MRVRTRLGAVTAAVALGASALAAMGGTAHALGNPAHPQLAFDHTITSHPFSGAPGNAIDIEGLGFVPADNSMWVADDNGDRVWEIDPTTGAWKSTLRGGNPSVNPANIDFTTATQVGTGLTCALALDGAIVGDTGDNECLSRTDDFESAVFDPGATAAAGDDVLYVTSGNCCTAGLPAGYPYHPTVWKLTRDGLGHFKPSQWQALPEGTDPTAAGLRPGGGLYFGHSKKVQTYNFASNALGSDMSIGVSTDIVGLAFTDANTVFVTTATPNTASGRTTATSDSTIQRFDISGSSWTANTTWKFPLKNIGNAALGVDNAGMIDARDLAIVSSGGVDKFYVSDGYDSRASNDHPIYVYNLVDGITPPPPPTGPSWHYSALNGNGSGVTTDHFGGGNALLQYGAQLHGFYQDTSKSSLAHSWWDGAHWNYENLDGNGVHTGDSVGANVTAIQYGSQLQLFYTDASTHTLRHAWWDGAWHFEALDGAGGGGGRTSNRVGGGEISVRQYGAQLQLFYSDDTAHALRHAWYDGGWHFETLDTGLPSSSTYVAATQYGATLQVLYAGSGGNLRHAWYDNGWHKETLDGSGSTKPGHSSDSVGNYATVLQFGSQLDAVYQDTSTSALRHAWWDGAKWNYETLDGVGGNISGHTNNHVGAHIATLPYSGGLHIVYQDTDTGALRHAWYAGGWHVEILDGSGGLKAGSSTSSNTGLFATLVQYGTQLQLTYFDHSNADRLVHTWYA